MARARPRDDDLFIRKPLKNKEKPAKSLILTPLKATIDELFRSEYASTCLSHSIMVTEKPVLSMRVNSRLLICFKGVRMRQRRILIRSQESYL